MADYLSLVSISLLCHVGPYATNGVAFAVLVSVACLAPLTHVFLSKAPKLKAWAARKFKRWSSAPATGLDLSLEPWSMNEAVPDEFMKDAAPPSTYRMQDT